jgi:hypothetical protein
MLAAIIWMAILVAIYIGTYILNKKTPKPEGCEELKECSGCANVACSHYKKEEGK